MKTLKLITLCLLISVPFYSQTFLDKNLSFEIKYPAPIGDNFITDNYTGIINLGIDYNFFKTNNLGIGILANTAFLKTNSQAPSNANLWTLSPKFKFDYNFNIGKISIIPQLGVGYSYWSFSPDGFDNIDYNGFSTSASTKILFNSDKKVNLYAILSYEFTRLEKPDNLTSNFSYNQNIHHIYPGIGITWNFEKK